MASDLEASQQATLVERQAAEQARTELTKAQLRLDGLPRLEAELERLRAAPDAERAARTAAYQLAAVSVAKLEKTEAQVTDLQNRLDRAEKEARAIGQDSARLREQAQALQTSFEVAVRDGNQARDGTNRAETEASELRGQLLALREASSNPLVL